MPFASRTRPRRFATHITTARFGAPLLVALALPASTGCTLITDVDRSKIPTDLPPESDAGESPTPDMGHPDAGSDNPNASPADASADGSSSQPFDAATQPGDAAQPSSDAAVGADAADGG